MKIAFCFLIYDTINHEDLWNLFFQNVDTNKYAIYIHYKTFTPFKYFEKHRLDNCIETEYAKVSLIHAQRLLFSKAYDEGCYKMFCLSNSCIPLKSFDYIYHFLTRDDFGHFNIAPQSQRFPRARSLIQYYGKNIIQKSSQWFILNRTICQSILNYDKNKIDDQYRDVYAPEEFYFITNVFHHNLQDQIITTPNLSNNATTFTNWQGMNYKYPSTKGLRNYSSITEEELLYLISSDCLFGRKFTSDSSSSLHILPYIQLLQS